MNADEPVDWAARANAPDPCVVCGATDAAPRYSPTFHDSLAAAPDYFLAHRTATAHGPIVTCQTCGFVFTSPRFAPADYDMIYRSTRVPHEGDAGFDAAKSARFRRLAAIVREYAARGSSFVDFGCGDGAFLREMDDPAGIGFEIGAPGRSAAGQSEIILGNWADTVGSTELALGSFDFVTAFDVLEHLPRIEQDVALVRSLLKPDGLFFASVPNVASRIARIMGKRWNMLLLEHLWYFAPDTFRRFMARHCFEMVAVRNVPFDAPVAHVVTRLAQTFGMKGAFVPSGIAKFSVPVPAGIMLGVFRAV